jgi:hypothetical protein
MSVSAYFTSAPFISSSLSFLATLVVLMWVYQRTRLPAALANLVWKLLSRFALPLVTQALFVRAPALVAGDAPISVGSPLGLWSMLITFVDAGLFIWLLISLVQQARPETLLGNRNKQEEKRVRPLPITER